MTKVHLLILIEKYVTAIMSVDRWIYLLLGILHLRVFFLWYIPILLDILLDYYLHVKSYPSQTDI